MITLTIIRTDVFSIGKEDKKYIFCENVKWFNIDKKDFEYKNRKIPLDNILEFAVNSKKSYTRLSTPVSDNLKEFQDNLDPSVVRSSPTNPEGISPFWIIPQCTPHPYDGQVFTTTTTGYLSNSCQNFYEVITGMLADLVEITSIVIRVKNEEKMTDEEAKLKYEEKEHLY